MPYLTPETLPSTDTCRRLLIPDSPEWLAIVSGALTELLFKWNWQQKGITVDETLAALQAIVDSYYNQPCQDPDACFLPGGTALIRRLPDGTTEQFIDGVWSTPEGDYASTPPEPREESTESERLCLAAANTANALRLTYEAVVEEYEEFANVEDVIEVMLAVVGFLFAPYVSAAALALLALEALAFNTFFEALEFVGADDWSEEFNEKVICLLLDHATEDEDERVTYNFADFYADVNAGSLDFLNPSFMRPFSQLAYMLYYIGAEGLNSSSGTTAISEADCDDCEDTAWCYYFDFRDSDGGWIPDDIPPEFGTWVTSDGWNSEDKVITITNPDQARRAVQIKRLFSAPASITHFEVLYDYTGGTFSTPSNPALQLVVDGTAVLSKASTAMSNGSDRNDWWDGSISSPTSVTIVLRSSTDVTSPYAYSGACKITSVRLEGTGTNPFGEDDCPE